jgi:hypothetical protein
MNYISLTSEVAQFAIKYNEEITKSKTNNNSRYAQRLESYDRASQPIFISKSEDNKFKDSIDFSLDLAKIHNSKVFMEEKK